MALYLLDKNIVEDIKKSLKGVPTSGVALARAIDRKGNIASPLLSIMEGSSQRGQTGAELHDQLMVESQAVGMFYHHARTDAEYLQEMGTSAAAAFAPHMREKSSALVPLAMELQRLLPQQRNYLDARSELPKIDALAVEHGVPLAHPLVTAAVACLYGNVAARGVLKPAVNPTSEGAYNAVADFRLMMETAYIRNMWNERGSRQSVRLHSADKHLNTLSRLLEIKVQTAFSSEEAAREIVSFESTMKKELLPSLREREKEMQRALDYLRASRDGEKAVLA
ncbi:hypothetical protein [Pelomonas cellulosilytica]|uniref:Uncharacterized protein n=1 Tax=Pelomonas cellulosilytica TaxID=2906762 RepID=A0ABS8XR02_9BURK|nr:hypothetical protein [Pelomonas sp. P8]MCE4554258.1 hypothetical protein [Pelomonas sp. P8]